MTYEEAREFIDHSNQYGSKLGLETITELLSRLGNPQDKLKVIHVAGTNGKGSTTAFIASILVMEGYLVGRYISPAVFSYRERIQISEIEHRMTNNDRQKTEYITKLGVGDTIATIKTVCEAMVLEGFSHPTSFEIETAMAMLYFYWKQVDFAVIEVGLGGRLDATNVIKQPVCSVITSISMDHMQYLGDTIEQIAKEKAGIIKPYTPVITCNTLPEVLQVLELTCKEKSTALSIADINETAVLSFSPEGTAFCYQAQEYRISLLGMHQISNAILAICTMDILRNSGISVGVEAVKQGLFHAQWSGRFEVIARDPYFILDGAHNEDAADRLSKAIRMYFAGRRIIYVMGVFADKDYRRILRITAPFANMIITLTPNNSRALESFKLAAEAKKYCSTVIDAKTAEQAMVCAYQEAKAEDVILAFGSLSFLGELRRGVIQLARLDLED